MHPVDYVPNPKPANWKDTDYEWPKFFRLPVLMLMLITLLNDGTLISIGYDNVHASQTPEKWNLRALFTIASVLGGIACLSSLLMLHVALDSWNSHGFWQFNLGLPGLSFGQIITMMYLKVSISDFLTLFSARAIDGFFWSVKPSKILLVAGTTALAISTLLANVWPASKPDDTYTLGLARSDPKELSLFVWIYCIICWIIQDIAKVATSCLLHKFNIFGVNDIVGKGIREVPVTKPPSSPKAPSSLKAVANAV